VRFARALPLAIALGCASLGTRPGFEEVPHPTLVVPAAEDAAPPDAPEPLPTHVRVLLHAGGSGIATTRTLHLPGRNYLGCPPGGPRYPWVDQDQVGIRGGVGARLDVAPRLQTQARLAIAPVGFESEVRGYCDSQHTAHASFSGLQLDVEATLRYRPIDGVGFFAGLGPRAGVAWFSGDFTSHTRAHADFRDGLVVGLAELGWLIGDTERIEVSVTAYGGRAGESGTFGAEARLGVAVY